MPSKWRNQNSANAKNHGISPAPKIFFAQFFRRIETFMRISTPFKQMKIRARSHQCHHTDVWVNVKCNCHHHSSEWKSWNRPTLIVKYERGGDKKS